MAQHGAATHQKDKAKDKEKATDKETPHQVVVGDTDHPDSSRIYVPKNGPDNVVMNTSLARKDGWTEAELLRNGQRFDPYKVRLFQPLQDESHLRGGRATPPC